MDKSEDRAAAFHLANYFEGEENSQLAVHYFSKAGAYSTAIRLAMVNFHYFYFLRISNRGYFFFATF